MRIGLPWGIAAHATVVLALAFATFLVLDWFNPLMGFTSNEVSTPLLAVFCVCSLTTSVRLLVARHGCPRRSRTGGGARAGRGSQAGADAGAGHGSRAGADARLGCQTGAGASRGSQKANHR